MGTYCTTTALDTLMVGTEFDSVTTALADQIITQAESEIDKRISNRYDLSSSYFQTSTAVPPVIRTICEWLSQGYMYDSLSRGGKESFTRADRFIDRAHENLGAIAEYNLDLLDSTGSVIPDKTNTKFKIISNTTNYPTTFNEDNELNWAISDDKLDDIDDERD